MRFPALSQYVHKYFCMNFCAMLLIRLQRTLAIADEVGRNKNTYILLNAICFI